MRRWVSCGVLCLSISFPVAGAGPITAVVDAFQQPAQAIVRGRVLDSTRAAVVGAHVTVTPDRLGGPASATTNQQGEFEVPLTPGGYTVRVSAPGFVEVSRRVTLSQGSTVVADFTLDVAGIREAVSVDAAIGYSVPALSSATKTMTPLRDVPQAVSVVSRQLIADQRMSSMADVTRYMPGVGFAQGEGNRDTPILRGNSSTSDFFVDGVRDDVQYFRDVYNVDRVEALKGPNAMIFGRGGVGGVINRVTRQADWGQSREASLQFGSWDNRDSPLTLAAVSTKRLPFAPPRSTRTRTPTVTASASSAMASTLLSHSGLRPETTLRASYEYFHDERIADRGISSFNGRPVETAPGTFFGDPSQSPTDATVNLVLVGPRAPSSTRGSRSAIASAMATTTSSTRTFSRRRELRGHDGGDLGLQQRDDPPESFQPDGPDCLGTTGRFGHTLLVGTEFGRQETDNFRSDGILLEPRRQCDDVQCLRWMRRRSRCLWVQSERYGRGQPRRDDDRLGLRTGSGRLFETCRGGGRPQVRQLQRRRDEQSHGDRLLERRRSSLAAPGR